MQLAGTAKGTLFRRTLNSCTYSPFLEKSENLFTLSPDHIVEVYDGDTFKINLPQQVPIFGDELSIRLAGVDTPEMKGTSDEVKA